MKNEMGRGKANIFKLFGPLRLCAGIVGVFANSPYLYGVCLACPFAPAILRIGESGSSHDLQACI